MSIRRPTLAVYKFSSCDGCQLQLLNMEDEILDLAQVIDIAYFLEATRKTRPGPYEIALVEGSVTTPHEIERIKEIRQMAQTVVALGTCATAGGIQALRNMADSAEYAETVYPHPEYLDYLETATPIADHIPVDLELWGCPVNKFQVLEVISALLQKRHPNLPNYSVCLECKQRATLCVLVGQGIPCLGPVTQAGCGGICPSIGRGCYGCFGPQVQGNFDAFIAVLKSMERYPGEIRRLLSHVSNYAPAFQAAAASLAAQEK